MKKYKFKGNLTILALVLINLIVGCHFAFKKHNLRLTEDSLKRLIRSEMDFFKENEDRSLAILQKAAVINFPKSGVLYSNSLEIIKIEHSYDSPNISHKISPHSQFNEIKAKIEKIVTVSNALNKKVNTQSTSISNINFSDLPDKFMAQFYCLKIRAIASQYLYEAREKAFPRTYLFEKEVAVVAPLISDDNTIKVKSDSKNLLVLRVFSYDPAIKCPVEINGQQLKMNDGYGTFKEQCNTPGRQMLKGKVIVKAPDGSMKSYEFKEPYYVYPATLNPKIYKDNE